MTKTDITVNIYELTIREKGSPKIIDPTTIYVDDDEYQGDKSFIELVKRYFKDQKKKDKDESSLTDNCENRAIVDIEKMNSEILCNENKDNTSEPLSLESYIWLGKKSERRRLIEREGYMDGNKAISDSTLYFNLIMNSERGQDKLILILTKSGKMSLRKEFNYELEKYISENSMLDRDYKIDIDPYKEDVFNKIKNGSIESVKIDLMDNNELDSDIINDKYNVKLIVEKDDDNASFVSGMMNKFKDETVDNLFGYTYNDLSIETKDHTFNIKDGKAVDKYKIKDVPVDKNGYPIPEEISKKIMEIIQSKNENTESSIREEYDIAKNDKFPFCK